MKTIMIYDADRDLVELMCLALELEGYRTFGFHDSRANCLDVIRSADPGLVLLDFRQSGEFIINWCRSIKEYRPGLPVIALSCNNHIHELYKSSGFDGCLSKPFELEELYRAVRRYFIDDREIYTYEKG